MPLKDMTSRNALKRNVLETQLTVTRAFLEDHSFVRDALLAVCDTIEMFIDYMEEIAGGQKDARSYPQDEDGWPQVEGGKIQGCCGPSQGGGEAKREARQTRSRRARPQD
jgi:hypothetical protein